MFFSAIIVSAPLLLLLPPPPTAAFAASTATDAAGSGRPNCTTVCGNTSIPYPFGVEPGCYRPGFDVTCTDGVPPKLLLHNISEVFDISLADGTVDIYIPRFDASSTFPNFDVYASNFTVNWDVIGGGVELDGGTAAFVLSARRNKLVLVACDIQVLLLTAGMDVISTCAAFCPPVSVDHMYMVGSPDCSGVGCCQAAIPAGLNVYELQLRRFNGSWSGNQSWVYIVNSELLSSYRMDEIQAEALPAVMEWVISNSSCQSNSTSPECRSNNSFCQNSTTFNGGHRCHCSQGYDGNPYILDGCIDIDECKFPEIYPCFGDCNNTLGGYTCRCPHGFEDDLGPHGFEGDAFELKGCKGAMTSGRKVKIRYTRFYC